LGQKDIDWGILTQINPLLASDSGEARQTLILFFNFGFFGFFETGFVFECFAY